MNLKCTLSPEKGNSLAGHRVGLRPLTGTGIRRSSSCAPTDKPQQRPRPAPAELSPQQWPHGSCFGQLGMGRLEDTHMNSAYL